MAKSFYITMIALVTLIAPLLLTSISSAILIQDVKSDTIYPGKEGQLRVEVENELNDDIEDVTLSLDLTNTPFSTTGSSEDTIDQIDSDDSDTFIFTLTTSATAKEGDYNIPYILTYKNISSTKKGTIGVKIRAKTNLDYSVSIDNPIEGEQAKMTLKIINKGLGDARFVSVKLIPDGYTLLSEDSTYIGNIASDDFETTSFDISITSLNPILTATIDYEDLDSKHYTKDIALSLNVYSEQKAYELGIKTKSKGMIYISILILIILTWFIVRTIRKFLRKRKSVQSAKSR